MKRITVVFRPAEGLLAAPRVPERDLGFRPAYFDFATGAIHLSRYPDGRPAPLHLLDGLPDEVVIVRGPSRRVVSVKSSLVAGFERNGFFFTRSAAERAVREWGLPRAPL